ncbi:MAG: CehA/McbA family metallohydrolase [Candidatus Latescibacteria bacterium]|nr:CehA/McbA family metallohydrolase [Candidatus Latescibacterota bacterium]
MMNGEEPGFIVLSGEEVSCGSNGRNVHLLAYGISDYIPGAGDSAKRGLQTDPDLTVEEVLHRVRNHGGVAYASHPLEPSPFFQRLILRRGVWTVHDLEREDLTGWLFWNGELSPGFLKGAALWRETLLKGKRVCLAAGNDAHGNFNRFRQVRIPFIALIESDKQLFGDVKTCLYSERPLTTSSVLDALRGGHSIITDGPFLTCEVIIDGRVSGVGGTVSGHRGIVRVHGKTTGEFGRFQEITVYRGDLTTQHETVDLRIHDKGYVWEETIAFIVHHPTYFRAEGRTVTGKRCLSNPIWVNPL